DVYCILQRLRLHKARYQPDAGTPHRVGHSWTLHPSKGAHSTMMESGLGKVPLRCQLPFAHRICLDLGKQRLDSRHQFGTGSCSVQFIGGVLMRTQLNTCPLTVTDPLNALRSDPVRSIKFPECNGPYFFCLDVSVELTPPFSSLDRCGACRIVVDVLAHDRPASLCREHARQVDPLPL